MKKFNGKVYASDLEEAKLLHRCRMFQYLKGLTIMELVDLYALVCIEGPKYAGNLTPFWVKQELSSRYHGNSVAAMNYEVCKNSILALIG